MNGHRSRLPADDPVGDIGRKEKVVGDDERSTVAGLGAEQSGELELALRIHPPSRLVENEQIRFGDEDRGEREALPLAAGEVARVAALVAPKAYELECSSSPFEVAADAERDLLVNVLGDDVPPRILAQIGSSAGALNDPLRRLEQACNELGQRRLARAVGAHERDDLAAAQLEIGHADKALAVSIGRTLKAGQRISPGVGVALDRFARKEGRALRRQPAQGVLSSSVEHDSTPIEENHPVGTLERQRRTLLRDDDGAAELDGVVEERFGAVRVELRGRLVEQQQRRAEGKRGGHADALQLARRKLVCPASGEVIGADRPESFERSASNPNRLDTDVLEPEGDLVLDDGEDDLVLRVLEDAGDGPGQVTRSRATRVATVHFDSADKLAAVEVRDEPGEGAK
jgi:hypothetical protein